MMRANSLQIAQMHQQAGRLAEAEAACRQAVAEMPQDARVYHVLGNILKAGGRMEEALGAYRKAVEINPNFLEAQGCFGVLLLDAGRQEEGEAALRKAVALGATPQYFQPALALQHYHFGLMLQRMKLYELAADCFRNTILLNPDRPEPYQCLAGILETIGKREEAIAMYRNAISHGAKDPEFLFHASGLTGSGVPPQQPPDSVAKLFDNMAETFDRHLKSLRYEAPQEIYKALLRVGGMEAKFGDVVDLGCGTGLCAELLKRHSRTITGIDVSTKMLAKAREKGLYDELMQQELVPALRARAGAFDLAISADVFIYIGELEPIFAALANSLREDAIFGFSIELYEPAAGAGNEDYELRKTRRYAQSLAYIRRLAGKYGFAELSCHEAPIREETPDDVMGAIFVLRKTGQGT